MSGLDALLDWYGTLSAPALARLPEFYHPAARFKDPFNDVQGLPEITRVFAHMFDTTDTPRFHILERVAGAGCAYVSWDFEFGLRGTRYHVHGATRFSFDAAGLVTDHRDYWDPAEELWQKLPVIGGPVAWLRRRFRAA